MRKLAWAGLLALLAVGSSAQLGAAQAAEVKVAVAANFTAPAKELAKLFHDQTGNDASLSFGATGDFYTQVSNGAPYEVFLAADADHPAKAESAGLAVSGSRFTYAIGTLVLWSKDAKLVDDKGEVLRHGDFAHLSIGDPKLAPYGAAAIETLQKLGVYDQVKSKIVQGASINQAFQFVSTGNAELGFVALSQVVNEQGSRWVVPENLHHQIAQQAVLLKKGADDPAAKAFLDLLKSKAGLDIIHKYGYGTP